MAANKAYQLSQPKLLVYSKDTKVIAHWISKILGATGVTVFGNDIKVGQRRYHSGRNTCLIIKGLSSAAVACTGREKMAGKTVPSMQFIDALSKSLSFK
jgi:hypothetical protein